MTVNKKSLILIHPAVTQQPELLETVKQGSVLSETSILDQFLINKLNDGSVLLEDNKYDIIYYVTPEKAEDIQFPNKLIPLLFNALRMNGQLFGLSDNLKVDALINGFDIIKEKEYSWVKKEQIGGSAVSISIKGNTNNSGSVKLKKLPSFKKIPDNGAQPKKLPTFSKLAKKVSEVKLAESELDELNEDLDSDDSVTNSKAKFFDEVVDMDTGDSIDEDDLISETEDVITMVTCGKSKQRRRKACKDCTCGLKEMEEQEIESRRMKQQQVIKFSEDDLTEIDFTIEGKKVGGCGSCALGDAFRCSGCPYLGLPAFKPGQPINLNSISDDL